MKKMKRILALATTLCLSGAFLLWPTQAEAPTLPENWVNPFSDVKDAWYTPFVARLHEAGVIGGYPDGRFGVGKPCKVGEVLLMVAKAAGFDTLPAQEGDTHFAQPYARLALKYGWVEADRLPEDLDAPATRFFISRLIFKALDLTPSKSPSPFVDVSHNYLTTLYELGLVAGTKERGKLYFKPDEVLTREALSVMVYRITEYMEGRIRYRDHVLDIDPAVPAMSYDKSAFVTQDQRLTYTGAGVEPLWGVDVSKHQGEIDWNTVAQAGVDFAILRAGGRGYGSEGKLYEDECFQRNLEGARDAGLTVGVYFFSQAISEEEAKEEAAYLLELIKDGRIDGPVVFDWENIGHSKARTDSVTGELLTKMALAFCEEIRGAGYEPMVYVNLASAYRKYDLAQLTDYPLWLAEVDRQAPSFVYDFELWQYSHSGTVPGIPGRVDLNLWLKPEK